MANIHICSQYGKFIITLVLNHEDLKAGNENNGSTLYLVGKIKKRLYNDLPLCYENKINQLLY